VLELNKQRDQISVLQRDVEAAQRDFEAVSQRSAHTRLESLAVQTNIAVLNPAAIPIEHSRPRILLNLLVSIFLGTLLALGIAVILELMNRRVRSEEDLLVIEVPVLAAISTAGTRSASATKKNRLLGLRPPRRAIGMEVTEH
jgi:polysaccharide biosynthesis transport protein